jgi:Flp pilus assembly protein TadG
MVEFALAFVLIFAVLTGIFQYGYGFFVYNTLVNAVRDGARYASNIPYSSTTTTPDNTYQTKVQNMVVYGKPSPGQTDQPILAGLATSNVAITMTPGNPGGLTPPTAVTVSIVGFQVDAVFSKINMNGIPFCIFPYAGVLTPPSN